MSHRRFGKMCLKDKSEHESPTEISSGCADFIAVNAACAEDITKFCDEAFFSDDTALCLSTWTSPEVLEWALPKPEAADEGGPTDELGLSEKAKRKAGRSAAIEKIRQDQKEEKELEALKKEDPAAYAQLVKEREEAKRSFEELKKRKRLMAAAEERERRQKMGVPDSEEESEEEAKKRKRIEERMEILREAKKKERVNWLPYVLGGLFVAYIFFNVLNVFGSGDKSKKEDDDDKDD
ncbi:hypothetical protein AK812_SmicGene893 [Symbiodinium microadriaticum]|uniref:Uncharacterized protein n=1 Tax=Symbiodinium microadriaticum TaxID=2951 RepID=A0A1Q9F5E8_SYMMI|nr:hypothetical protein AK812_SmicGene893 [Symbiodinium microadriaticum]